jgi:hypothetical protein
MTGSLIVITWIVAIITHLQKEKAGPRRRTRFEALIELVAGVETGGSIYGTWRGVPVKIWLRGSGPTERTVIELELPRGFPLSLEVRPTERAAAAAIRLRARPAPADVAVGDPAFDARTVVEIAPARFAEQILDGEVRSALGRTTQATLRTRRRGKRTVLVHDDPGWVTNIEHALDCVTTIAARLRAVHEAADRAVPPKLSADVYRGHLAVDTVRLDEDRAARAAEVDALDARRREREDA